MNEFSSLAIFSRSATPNICVRFFPCGITLFKLSVYLQCLPCKVSTPCIISQRSANKHSPAINPSCRLRSNCSQQTFACGEMYREAIETFMHFYGPGEYRSDPYRTSKHLWSFLLVASKHWLSSIRQKSYLDYISKSVKLDLLILEQIRDIHR